MTSIMQLFPYLQKRNEKQLQYSYSGSNGCGFPIMHFSHDWLHIRTRFSTPYRDLHFDVPVVHLPTDQYHVKRFNPHDSCFGVRTLHCRLSPPFPSGFGAHPFHHQESDVLYRTGSDSVLFDQYTKVFRDWNCDARNSKWGWQYDYIHHWCDRTEVKTLEIAEFFLLTKIFFSGTIRFTSSITWILPEHFSWVWFPSLLCSTSTSESTNDSDSPDVDTTAKRIITAANKPKIYN